MMATSPRASAHIADDVLYGDDNNKFVQSTNSTSPYINQLSSVQSEVSQLVSSSHQNTYKHFLAQKYAAESTSDADSESHSNSLGQLAHASTPFQHQISNFYPFSPLVTSSSSHFDTRNILNDGVLESSVDSLQVESSTNEQNSGHSSAQAIFTNNNNANNLSAIDNFVKADEAPDLALASNPSVTSSSSRSTDSALCRIQLVPSSLFDSVNADGTVDSTVNISTPSSLTSTLSSYTFNNFQTSTSQGTLSNVLTYGLSPNFSTTLLQIDNSQPLLPSLPSPSIQQIDQYFNQPILDKRDENVILDQHQLLPSAIHSFSNDSHCLLTDNLADNFLHDIPNEAFHESESVIASHENIINDLPVLTRARASLPIEYLYLSETTSGLGIFARKSIPKRTQFGPIEGVIVSIAENQYDFNNLALTSKNIIIFISKTLLLSQSDENNSNWTRFVRPAVSSIEQNLELVIKEYSSVNELKFYFYTTRDVMANEELKVWYSKSYCDRFGLKPLADTEQNLSLLSESEMESSSNQSNSNQLPNNNNLTSGGHKLRNKIAKSQLSQLQQNRALDEDDKVHDQSLEQVMYGGEIPDLFDPQGLIISTEPMMTVNNVDSLTVANESTLSKPNESKPSQYQCTICNRVFPRHYSLRRHLVMHSGIKRYKCPVCGMAFNHVYNRNRHLKKHNKPATESVVCESQAKPNSDSASTGANLVQEKVVVPTENGGELLVTTDNLKLFSSNKIQDIVTNNNSTQHLTIRSLIENSFSKNDNNNNFIHSDHQKAEFDEMLDSDKSSPATATSNDNCSTTDSVSSIPVSMVQGNSVPTKNMNQPGKPFRCPMCYKRFSTEERLEKHAMVHDESAKHLSCDICKRKFLTNSALSCHIKSHTALPNEPRTYDCTLCGELFQSIQARRDHVRVHVNPETGLFHCSKCSKTFDDFSPMRKHIKSFHSEEIFPCSQCDKVFPRQDKLRLHMLCHSDRWEFKCNFCEKQFKRKDKLKEHTQRMHAPDRDARIAAKLAARMQRLKAQRTKKIVTKPSQPNYEQFVYKCHPCLLGFKRRGMLVNHLAKRHPDVPYNTVPELNMPIVKTSKDYYCQYCDKIYKSSSKRKAHIIKNHPGKSLPPSNRNKGNTVGVPNTFSATVGSITMNPHFCGWCHKQYASKAKLMQHQRKKHSEKIIFSSAKNKSDSNLSCNSNSDSSVSSKFDSIGDSDKTIQLDVSRNDSISLSQIKPESSTTFKDHKLDPFLSGSPSSNGQYLNNFSLSSQYSKGEVFLNGANSLQQQPNGQFTIDSNDPSLDDLLNITTCIISDDQNQNLLISNSTSAATSLPNNIITILACTVPSTCTTFSNELNEFPNGISDIITQITSDYPTSKLLNSSQVSPLSNEANDGNLVISEELEENNWNQVCGEIAIV